MPEDIDTASRHGLVVNVALALPESTVCHMTGRYRGSLAITRRPRVASLATGGGVSLQSP